MVVYNPDELRDTYDKTAEELYAAKVSGWKVAEREHFLRALEAERKRTLLELGAGPGRDALFFKENGLEVTATDLSPEMVRLCQEKGLTARVMDFGTLVHLPRKHLPFMVAWVL